MTVQRWYEHAGVDGDVVVSTRIRLARNLREYPFPIRMNEEQRRELADKIGNALEEEKTGIRFRRIEVGKTSPELLASMVERHVASPEFVRIPGGVLYQNTDDREELISIMVGEEDHIRLQVMRAGMALDEAYQVAERLDDELDGQFVYAFDEKLGFLTQCPTNLGTGLRASVMLHLPALEKTGTLARIENSITKLGLTIRGTFGEGSGVTGSLYQISNQITLGISEHDAIENLKAIVSQIVEQERRLRSQLAGTDSYEDQVHRALGTLQSARILSSEEFYKLISFVRMGISTGTIEGVSLETVNSLIWSMGSAGLMEIDSANKDVATRDKSRAQIVRSCLASSQ